jgi:hypothetical protein
MRYLPRSGVVLRATFGMVLVLLCGLAFSTAAGAQVPLTPTDSPLPGGSRFQGADGNQVLPDPQLMPPVIDWATLVGQARVAHSPDPNPDNAFKAGSSELEPDHWRFEDEAAGVDPGKANILDAWSSVEQVPQPGFATNTFLYLAFARAEGASSAAFLTFELNRDDRLWENSEHAFVPCRRNGDLLITFVPAGNSVSVDVQRWRTSTTATFGCAATGTLSANESVTPNADIQGALNLNATPIGNPLGPPLGSSSATLAQYQFGETAINLGKVLSLVVGSTCGAFTSFWMHSRSSPAVTSNMQDIVTPHAIHARRCSASGTKYLDSNANGQRDEAEPGLAGWRIYADLNDNHSYDGPSGSDLGEPYAVTDEQGDYTIDDIKATGTYTLREERTSAVPQATWTCSDPSPSCAHVVNAGDEPDAQGLDFGNWRPALLTLTKEVHPKADTGLFNLTASSAGTTVTFEKAGNNNPSKTFDVRPGTSYTVSEAAAEGTNPADYGEPSVECARVTRLGRRLRGATASTGVILAGEHVECTFVNTRIGTPSVTLRKVLVGPVPAMHGDTLRYRLAVINTSSGNFSFPEADVHVTDERCTPRLIRKLNETGAEDLTPGSLDPLDRWIYGCRVRTHHVDPATCQETPFDNTGEVTVAPDVSDDDRTETMLGCPVPRQPAVAIQKIGPETAQAGTPLTYVFYVRNIGDIPFTQERVTVTDPACDATPELVARYNADGDPDTSSPSVLSPGDVWVYTCTNSTPAPGAACQPSVVPNTGSVVATTRRGRRVEDSDDFYTSLTCVPGPPAPQPQPEAPAPTPNEMPSAVIPPTAGVAGEASLSPIRGCLRRGSRVVINGTRIANITVTVRGRRVGGLRVTTFQRRAVIRVVGNLTPGRHRAIATIRFQRGAGTPAVRITRTVRVCGVQTPRPPFTG